MAGGIDWFRWHHGSVNDPKFRLVAKRAEARVAEVLAVWACLLETASAADDRGNAGMPDFEALDLSLDMVEGTAGRIYQHLCERGTIDHESGRVVAWEKRQPKRERPEDNSTDRVRAHRANLTNETPCNATQHPETPREEKSREENINTKSKTLAPSALTGIDPQIAKDWQALRKSKKAPVTETAIAGIKREADKAGLSLQDALALCCQRGWAGFKAEWTKTNGQGAPPNGVTPYQQMQIEKHEERKRFTESMRRNRNEPTHRTPIDITPERVD